MDSRLGPRDPDLEGRRTWNGVFPSLRQVWILACWLATPARSASYGPRYNAWRIATDREPLTETDLTAMREMLLWDRGTLVGDLVPVLRRMVRRVR